MALPGSTTTGVRDGTSLQVVGDMTVTTNGAIISGLEIHGTLRIEADNVIVRDCKIVDYGGFNGILIPDGNTGAVVEYCDIIGPINGISGTGIFRFNDFSHVENGVNVYGPSMINDNYIHDMSGTPEAHFDGIEINGGGGTSIIHNTIINDNDQTSAIMMDNYFGGIHGIVIDGNYLAGGGYTVYVDDRFTNTTIDDIQITNNYLGQGFWGYYAFYDNQNVILSGNHLMGPQPWPSPDSIGGPSPLPVVGSVTISDGTVTEGNADIKMMLFTVTRGGGTAAFDVSFATSDGTATVADNDYVANSSVLHFGDSINVQTLSVTINGDTKVEAAEVFNVYLSDATNGAIINDGHGVGTITDDDAHPPIVGTNGNDVIKGAAGADIMIGRAGNDTYTVNSDGDQVIELANQGVDKIESTITYLLADNVENLQLMGNAQINGSGNGLSNTIIGNDVANTLSGGDGNDTLNGWGGMDILFGGSGNDTFQFSSQFSANGDKIMDFNHGDKLDFRKIDANAGLSRDQAFVFNGQSGNAHLWVAEDQAMGVTHVYGNTGEFEFYVDLQGLQLGLTSSDFLL